MISRDLLLTLTCEFDIKDMSAMFIEKKISCSIVGIDWRKSWDNTFGQFVMVWSNLSTLYSTLESLEKKFTFQAKMDKIAFVNSWVI